MSREEDLKFVDTAVNQHLDHQRKMVEDQVSGSTLIVNQQAAMAAQGVLSSLPFPANEPNQRDACVQECLDQSWQYRQNAAIRHGLEAPPRNIISRQLAGFASSVSSGVANRLPSNGLVKKAVVGLGIAGAGLGGVVGKGIYDHLTTSPSPPIGGNLLEYLEQEGYNHPPLVKDGPR